MMEKLKRARRLVWALGTVCELEKLQGLQLASVDRVTQTRMLEAG